MQRNEWDSWEGTEKELSSVYVALYTWMMCPYKTIMVYSDYANLENRLAENTDKKRKRRKQSVKKKIW